jgi:DDE superfamily endonuclease
LLTLFRPTTGEVRGEPAVQTTNAVLHPWLKRELGAILAQCPAAVPETADERRWAVWDWPTDSHLLDAHLPPIHVIVILDNLKGHHSYSLVQWCAERGILLLHTPVGGSWLNLAESVQRIIGRRALAGQHPQSVPQLQEWLTATVRGWNTDPTPFVWGGKRAARRARARQRRYALGGSGGCSRRPIRRRPRLSEQWLQA